MTDDFERQLRALFAETSGVQEHEAFEHEVRARISRLRRARRALARVALVLTAAALAVIGVPLVPAVTAVVVETAAPVAAAPAWLWSPIVYAIGVLSIVAAVVDALTD